jgi:hypothetical protein
MFREDTNHGSAACTCKTVAALNKNIFYGFVKDIAKAGS